VIDDEIAPSGKIGEVKLDPLRVHKQEIVAESRKSFGNGCGAAAGG
jgi:hypothetical protein